VIEIPGNGLVREPGDNEALESKASGERTFILHILRFPRRTTDGSSQQKKAGMMICHIRLLI
jgi:hypothetical protein